MSATRRPTAVVLATLVMTLACLACGDDGPSVTVRTAQPSATLATQRADATTATAPPTPTPTPDGTVTLAAVGDIMLNRTLGWIIGEHGPAAPFEGVAPLLAAADLTIGNLECAISDLGSPEPKAYTFRAPPEAAAGLREAGFDVVGIANNHALDYGVDAFLDTLTRVEAEGIRVAGGGANEAAAHTPAVIERDGLRIAVLAYGDVPGEYTGYDLASWDAGPDTPGIAWLDSTDEMAADVAAAAAEADHVIVMVHFGNEGATEPNDDQRWVAQQAIDAGATLVLGAHPHVLQPVEEYGGGLIAYSLGNFVFDGFDGIANNSAILQVTLTREGIAGWELVPVEIDGDGRPWPVP